MNGNHCKITFLLWFSDAAMWRIKEHRRKSLSLFDEIMWCIFAPGDSWKERLRRRLHFHFPPKIWLYTHWLSCHFSRSDWICIIRNPLTKNRLVLERVVFKIMIKKSWRKLWHHMCAAVMLTIRVGKFFPKILLAYCHHRQLENWQHWLTVRLTRRKPHRIINEERDEAKVKCIHRVLTVASRGEKNCKHTSWCIFFFCTKFISIVKHISDKLKKSFFFLSTPFRVRFGFRRQIWTICLSWSSIILHPRIHFSELQISFFPLLW